MVIESVAEALSLSVATARIVWGVSPTPATGRLEMRSDVPDPRFRVLGPDAVGYESVQATVGNPSSGSLAIAINVSSPSDETASKCSGATILTVGG
jgi:hypothetical protein